MRITQNSSQKHCACLASPSTSCTEGTRPPAPGSPRRSSSDVANAFCRTRQQTAPPVCKYATWALAWRIFGADFAFCCAKHCTKLCVSLDHLPPTPSWLFLKSHTVSGSSFRLRVCLRATPLVVSASLSANQSSPNAMSKSLMMTSVDTMVPPRVGDSTLHGMTSPAQHLAACCSVTAKNVKRTTNKRLERSNGKRRRRQQQHPE